MKKKISDMKKQLAAVGARIDAGRRRAAPGVIICKQVSDGSDGRDIETRPPGVYRGGREVVYRDEAERKRLVASVVPPDAHPPLTIIAGPSVLPPAPPLPGDEVSP